MVMHARKTQRMNDGYFEKHQAHPYQNSKYSSSKSYSERYDRIRDSPNGNYRSDSPDSQSPRDRERSYQSKGSYLQKIREKERENRDYKRDKYSDCARSPKDKRNREPDHRTNNEDKSILHPIKMSQNVSRDRKPDLHNNSIDKRDERDRVPRVGDWSEHMSSSGKKYYYNCKTEVSQWEKPREWIERERDRFRSRERDRDRDSERNYRSNSTRHEKHSNSRSSNSTSSSNSKDHSSSSSSRHWNSSSNRDDDGSKDHRNVASLRKSHQHSDVSVGADSGATSSANTTQDMDISPGDSTPTSEPPHNLTNCGESSVATTTTTLGPVLLANALPRLLSQTSAPTTPTLASNAPGPPTKMTSSSVESTDKNVMCLLMRRESGDASGGGVLSVDTSNHTGVVGGEGPPTPTHSETPDCTKTIVSVPVSSPQANLSSLQGMSSSLQALRPQGPSITPSLANHYRDDLVNHVRGWPAEILEKQAQKLADEAHIMGSIHCSKVSAELKSARSIVRLTEIQATLQEQRILFLRQQIKELEELKSQNSFMSDDC